MKNGDAGIFSVYYNDVDIFNIIQKVQNTDIHLKVDEEQMADHTRK